MAEVGIEYMFLGGGDLVERRELGRRRADRIHQPGRHPHPAADPGRQVLHVNVAEPFKERIFVRVLQIPQNFLVVAIIAMSVVGAYSISTSAMDVISMCAGGLIGYILIRYKFGVAPMALGLILGGMMEEGFKLSLHLGAAEGNVVMFFFSRPQSLVLIALTVLSLVYSIWKEISAARKAGQAAA